MPRRAITCPCGAVFEPRQAEQAECGPCRTIARAQGVARSHQRISGRTKQSATVDVFESPLVISLPKALRRRSSRRAPPSRGAKILVIPDTQVKPGVNTDHLEWIGRYAAEKRPDIIVHLGDNFDLPSLSSYDKGKLQFEGRRLVEDIKAGLDGMARLMAPIRSVKGYAPRLVFLLGNHEQRLERAIESTAELKGILNYPGDFHLKELGWEVHEFLKPVRIQGIDFAHYFVSGVKGYAVSSAAALLKRRASSAIMGHVQLYEIAVHPATQHRAIFAGTGYTHDEKYLGPQGNVARRHVLILHEAKNGIFDLMEVSLEFLRRRYAA